MTREFAPGRLDVFRFTESAARVDGNVPVKEFPRVAAEVLQSCVDSQVEWNATGVTREGLLGEAVLWLQLHVVTVVEQECQRCLTPVSVDLHIDRWFRFAKDEATAAAEDEDSEEDVLVASRDFDLKGLIEDELLMEIPAAPRHDQCPISLQSSVADLDFDSDERANPNPFAVLGKLRKG